MTWPKGILFDVDGTLVDSEPLHQQTIRNFLDARGWEYDEALVASFTGRRPHEVFAHDPGPWVGFNDDPIALIVEMFTHQPTDMKPVAVAGAADLIRAVRDAGVRIGLVTSANQEWVDVCVGEVLGVLDHMDAVVTGDQVEHGKPAPDGFLLGADRLGLDPGDCWAFEDSPDGVRSAVAAGMGRVFGLTTTFGVDVLEDAGAHQIVADLSGIAESAGR